MHPVLLELGPVKLYSYGLMIAIGILVAYSVAQKKLRPLHLDPSRLQWFTLSILAGGFAGSKVLYWLTRLPDIPSDPTILTNLGDGWVVYGGILGGLLAGWAYCKNHGMNFLEMFDLVIPEVALAQGFGRIGCFLAGCCYGVALHDHPWYGLVFPENSLAPAGVALFPTQLIMSAFDFGLFFFLNWFSKKKAFHGEVGAAYLIAYSFGRFFLEFFRGDGIRGVVNGISTSQYIAVATGMAGILMIVWARLKKKNSSSQQH